MAMKNLVHPGVIVKGALDDLGLSVTAAAKALGVSRPAVSHIVKGRASLSPEMAVRLSKALGSTPEFWLRLQFAYDLAQVSACADSIHVERYVPAG